MEYLGRLGLGDALELQNFILGLSQVLLNSSHFGNTLVSQHLFPRGSRSSVPRKNKKERGGSLSQSVGSKERTRCAEESGVDKSFKPRAFIDGASAQQSCALETETDRKSSTNESSALETDQRQGLVEIRGITATELSKSAVLAVASIPVSSDCMVTTTTAEYFPRTSTSAHDALIDIEYLEYEQHVQSQARARALSHDTFGAPGGRHAWKTLIFWKRRTRPSSLRSFFLSGASTPRHHQTATPGRRSSRHGSRSNLSYSSTTVPLYTDEFSASSIQQQFSHRAWSEPMFRRSAGKMSMPQIDAEYCNMSPYTPLGNRRSRLAAAGPLYLV